MAAPTNTNTDDAPKKSKSRPPKNPDDPVRVIKTPVDLQRLKLEKLMKNPTKEVIIPDKSKEKAPRGPLEFIRNIWGSSAGAGSGDFHVYRGVRRREYARQKFIAEKSEMEELDSQYQLKLEQNKKEADERTAKNRAKRLKKRQKQKAKKKMKGKDGSAKTKSQESSDNDDSDEEDGEEESFKAVEQKGESVDKDASDDNSTR